MPTLQEHAAAAREWQQQGRGVSLSLDRLQGSRLLSTAGIFQSLGDASAASVIGRICRPLVGSIKVMLDAYREGKLDRLLLVHAQFVNTMTQQPRALQLLPIAVAAGQTRSCPLIGTTSMSPPPRRFSKGC